MNDQIKHIIWDWNGTLLNDIVLCKDIMNHLLTKNNLPVLSLERYREIFTFPVSEYYKLAGLDFKKSPFEVLGKEFMDIYEKRKYECKLFPGVADTLNYFKNRGITQSILSAYHHSTLNEIVQHFKLSHYFDKLSGLDNIYAGGKTEIGRKLLSELSFKKNEIVLIGDTIHDKDVADELGIKSIIIGDGHQDFFRLKNLNVPVYRNFPEFMQIELNGNLADFRSFTG